tara:strand:- start:298 stop:1209 length:912 start_codon:yes stop_codon:yes gene_type:complete
MTTKVTRNMLNTSIDDNGNATAITITSAENVGIATTSPSQKLEVTGNVYVGGGNYFTQSTSGYFFGGSGSFTNGVYGVGVNNMVFNVNGSERMRIASSGNVGIGCTDAQTPLEIDTSTANYRIQFTHTSGQNQIKSIDSDHSTMRALFYDASEHVYQTSGTEVLRLGSSTILINGGNGQTFSDYIRTYSKSQSITFSSSTSSTSTTLSGYLTYQFMIDATLHMGYSGNGAISTHIRVSLCNTYSGLSVSTLHTAYGQSHNSYHTFSLSGTGAYNTRQLVVTCNPQGGQNASNTSGTIYYGMGV